ncbi:MAG: hypothetical protein EGQ29_04535 [Clostridiales bacterium]|nr:hypothetical protein [Clostridiales bacterium]MBD9203841.1 hypothetical protein [Clostridiales bacterium]
MKKLLATILALVMALSLCTVAFAASENCTVADCQHVAAIGDTHYDTLAEAVAALPTANVVGGEALPVQTEIKLLKPTNGGFDFGTSDGKRAVNAILNLNEKVLTLGPAIGSPNTETNGIRVLAYSKLTIRDGVLKCSDEVSTDQKKVKVGVANYGDLTMTNVDLQSGNYLIWGINNRGNLVLEGNTKIATGTNSDTSDNPTLKRAAINNTPYDYFYDGVNATINVADSTVQVGKIVLNDESISTTVNTKGKTVLNLSAGQYGAIEKTSDGNGIVGNITGGTFSNSVDLTYLADGLKYEVYAGGKYSYFTNINDAVAAATEDDIVEDFRSPRGDGEDGYTVRLEDNNAVVARIHSFATSVSLPTLSKSGYTFKGWKDAEGKTYTSQYNIPTASNGEIIPPVSDAYVLTAVWSSNSYYYYSPSTTTSDTTTKGSPKTFDAGVGIYAVTALLSVTGMAWAGKKRH